MKEKKTYRFKGNTLILRKTFPFKAKHFTMLAKMKREGKIELADWTTKTGHELIDMELATLEAFDFYFGFVLSENGKDILKKLEAL